MIAVARAIELSVHKTNEWRGAPSGGLDAGGEHELLARFQERASAYMRQPVP